MQSQFSYGESLNYSRHLGQSLEAIRPFVQLCREGRLYEVERWAAEGKPLQLDPDVIKKGTRPKTALQIAIETGQHSLVHLLLRTGYQLQLEWRNPLDLALCERRWDLFDLLLEGGADIESTNAYCVLTSYNTSLYERFRAAGYDLTQDHEMAAILGHGTSNRPLFGFAKRHRVANPKIQRELNIALGHQAEEGNEKGVSLCLWAGADPHAPASDRDEDWDANEEGFAGWTAIEQATREGHLEIVKQLRPDPTRDDFDSLYRYANSAYIVGYLATMQPPKNLTSILYYHLHSIYIAKACSLPRWSRGIGTLQAVLDCKLPWQETDRSQLADIRRLILLLDDYDVTAVMSRMKRPEICAPDTYAELIRTPTMQARLLALRLWKKPITEKERKVKELQRLMERYDRALLYEQVWSKPARDVAKLYGFSGVMLGKLCRKLEVPVPPRGSWARIQNGYSVRKPPLPKLKMPPPKADRFVE